MLVVVLLELTMVGCKKKEAPPPPVAAIAGPCGWETIEAYRPGIGVVASRERLPKTSVEEKVELVLETRPNCMHQEAVEVCRQRIVAIGARWLGGRPRLPVRPERSRPSEAGPSRGSEAEDAPRRSDQ